MTRGGDPNTARSLDLSRCDWCGWPLAKSVNAGCTWNSCSMRPLLELSEVGVLRQEIRRLRLQAVGDHNQERRHDGGRDPAVASGATRSANRAGAEPVVMRPTPSRRFRCGHGWPICPDCLASVRDDSNQPRTDDGDRPGDDPRPWVEQVRQFVAWIGGSRCIVTGGDSGNRGCAQNCQGCVAWRLLAREPDDPNQPSIKAEQGAPRG